MVLEGELAHSKLCPCQAHGLVNAEQLHDLALCHCFLFYETVSLTEAVGKEKHTHKNNMLDLGYLYYQKGHYVQDVSI